MLNSLCIIPARWNSTRFPGKPMCDINGKPMIERVYDMAKNSNCFSRIIVATDHPRISNHINSIGGESMLTSGEHKSGTDRCAEVSRRIKEKYDVIINIQGDEPFFDPNELYKILIPFEKKIDTKISTLFRYESDNEILDSHNCVKLKSDDGKKATSFSRKRFNSNNEMVHIGIYGFNPEILQVIPLLQKFSNLNKNQNLEQIAWMQSGIPILITETSSMSISIDSPEDLKKAREKSEFSK